MGQRNITRILGDALKDQERFDMDDSVGMKVLPVTNDKGSLQIGDGTTDIDFTVFMGSTTQYAKFDVGASTVDLVGVTLNTNTAMNLSAPLATSSTIDITGAGNLTLRDNVEFNFGDADDLTAKWTGSGLTILPVADDTGFVQFGTTGSRIDLFWITGAGTQLQFDASQNRLEFLNIGITSNSTIITTGDGIVQQKTITESDAAVTVGNAELGGLMILDRAGVTAVTLPTPAAGNAGRWIEIVSTTTNQHTITAGANLIVATGDAAATTLTASAAIGNSIKLVSDGSLWYQVSGTGTWAPT
jgi:hypothetical protein